MEFIFMLTRQDQTIEDCLDLYGQIRTLGLRHIGIKDVGVPRRIMREFAAALRRDNVASYLEVVSPEPETALASARTAVELGFDCLLGGTDIGALAEIARGTATQLFPFPGRPHGHPTRLGGTPDRIEEDCRRALALGAAGCDLLAFRATEADPLDLVRAARRGLGAKRLIVAGSINGAARIRAIAEAGADAFTIGTALLDGSYAPRKGAIASQIGEVLNDCRAVL
jgi:hypothetical protein